MSGACSRKSVGMIVQNGEKILLIKRGVWPPGYALPAGHVDEGESGEDAARRELKEEVGLEAQSLKLADEERMLDNPCSKGSTWHDWRVYEVSARGDAVPNSREIREAGWYTREDIRALGARTEQYRAGRITDEEWERDPGLEPVMYDWFIKLRII